MTSSFLWRVADSRNFCPFLGCAVIAVDVIEALSGIANSTMTSDDVDFLL
jgi:hypothetical protein